MDAELLVQHSAAFTPETSCRGLGWLRVHADLIGRHAGISSDSLTSLDLSHNSLTHPHSLEPLRLFTCLRALSLTGNAIADPVGLMHLPSTLDTLLLSDNHLSELPDLGRLLPQLRWLDVSRNGLSSCVSLASCVTLLGAELGSNPFSSLEGLEQLHQLRALGLAGTGLRDELSLRPLSLNASLQSLALAATPVATSCGPRLRHLLHHLLPSLRWLDLEALSAQQHAVSSPPPPPTQTQTRPTPRRLPSGGAPVTTGGGGRGGRRAAAARGGAEAAAALRVEVEALRVQQEHAAEEVSSGA